MATSTNLLLRRVSTLLEAMPAAQAGDETSVHQARVASRRLREALPVAGASAQDAVRRALKQVRRVTRALGPVREIDVALGHLAEFGARGVSAPSAIAHVQRALERERDRRRREMLDALSPGRLQKLKQKLAPFHAAPPSGDSRAAALAEADRRVGDRGLALGDAIERAGAIYLPDRLHAVRVAVKKLRYALEIQRELRRSRATARIRQLKSVQELLGRLHDLEVLIEHTRAVQVEQAATDRRTDIELDGLVRALEAECREIHAVYVARRGTLVKLCETLAAVPDVRKGPHVAA